MTFRNKLRSAGPVLFRSFSVFSAYPLTDLIYRMQYNVLFVFASIFAPTHDILLYHIKKPDPTPILHPHQSAVYKAPPHLFPLPKTHHIYGGNIPFLPVHPHLPKFFHVRMMPHMRSFFFGLSPMIMTQTYLNHDKVYIEKVDRNQQRTGGTHYSVPPYPPVYSSAEADRFHRKDIPNTSWKDLHDPLFPTKKAVFQSSPQNIPFF